MSMFLLRKCCCGCDWRRAYSCETDAATDYYALVADVDLTKFYGIDDGAGRTCVYFADCFSSNPGDAATGLTEYDDCETCQTTETDDTGVEDFGPDCDCPDPDPFPDTLTVTGTQMCFNGHGGAGPCELISECDWTIVLTKTSPCFWQNIGATGKPCGDCGGPVNVTASLRIDVDCPPGIAPDCCVWSLSVGTLIAYFGEKIGHPQGAYPDMDITGVSPCVVPFGYRNVRVA